jgi:small subunit ribosomal protein S6
MQKSRKHLYEGMYILNATLSEEGRKKFLDKISASITEEGGEVHKVFEQGRRKLAYAMEGRREGYYYVMFFSANPEGMAQRWRDYHLSEDLIRFTTLRVDAVPETLEFKPLVRE